MTGPVSEEHVRARAAWEGRVASMETIQQRLQGDVSMLTKDVSALLAASENLTSSIRVIAENQTAGLKTNWAAVIGVTTVIVMAVGLVVYQPLVSLSDHFRSHIDDGHPKSVLDRVLSDSKNAEERMHRKSKQITVLETKVGAIEVESAKTTERLLGLERDIYPNAKYRAGRPVGSDAAGQK